MNFEDSSQLFFLFHGGENVEDTQEPQNALVLKENCDMFPSSRTSLARTRRKSSPDVAPRRLSNDREKKVDSTASDLSYEHIVHGDIEDNDYLSGTNDKEKHVDLNLEVESSDGERPANNHNVNDVNGYKDLATASWPWDDVPGSECYNRMSKSYDNEKWEQLDVSHLQSSFSNITPFTNSNENGTAALTQSQTVKSSGFTSYLANPYSGTFDVEKESIKTKFISAWNNVRHGWAVKTKTNFKIDSQIWLLGKCYHCKLAERDDPTKSPRNPIFEKFKVDFFSKIWFTYRKDFPPLPSSLLTSDVGWGCMLRSGQMMLAQALILHTLGRDWRWNAGSWHSSRGYHEEIIQFFADFKSQISPFSIHNLVEIGMEHGKKPGDWYGPASAAYVLREAVTKAAQRNPIINNLCLYIAQDCTIYKQDVINLCSKKTAVSNSHKTNNPLVPSTPKRTHHEMTHHHLTSTVDQPSTSNSSPVDDGSMKYASWNNPNYERTDSAPSSPTEEPWRSVIILVPVRLGGESFNPVYAHCIKNLFTSDLCLGIIGGKPKHSLYFMGWQEDKLIHLDPHCCQSTIDVGKDKCALDSYHCSSPRKMPIDKMDPSCTVGFYCRTKDDFDRLVKEVPDMATPSGDKNVYPMFVCSAGSSQDIEITDTPAHPERRLRIQHLDKKGRLKQQSKDSDDFVLL